MSQAEIDKMTVGRRRQSANWRSSRNLSKQMRAIRVHDDGSPVDRLTMMKWGNDGKVTRTDGRFGTLVGNNAIRVNTSKAPPPVDADMDRASKISVTSGMPGKMRNFKKKGVARAHDKRDFVDTVSLNVPMLRNLRADILTALWMSKHSGHQIIHQSWWEHVREITAYLLTKMQMPEVSEMFEKDKHRENSVRGQVRSGNMQAQPIKKLGQRIDRAMMAIRQARLQGKVLGTLQ